jgi:hypothetical protein
LIFSSGALPLSDGSIPDDPLHPVRRQSRKFSRLQSLASNQRPLVVPCALLRCFLFKQPITFLSQLFPCCAPVIGLNYDGLNGNKVMIAIPKAADWTLK